ncbi:MAG: T9SS type A sorting domain-containing protein, partial [Ferruginibacter sp.]
DPDGTITNYQWTKISGPTAGSITNPTSAIATATGLVQGTYNFQLEVTDNNGATATDVMNVTVFGPGVPPNQAPSVQAGPDQNLTLPLNTTTLSGSATDPDGNIISYQWTKIAGPANVLINNPATAITSITNLVQGIYKFELKATDNNGSFARDTMQVNVSTPVPPNQRPSANAGKDINIYLPANFTPISGSATDADGSVVSFNWSMISGPSQYFFDNTTNAVTSVSNLQQGTYEVELTVLDNKGASGKDTLMIYVGSSRTSPEEVIRIFPNPVQEDLSIEISTSRTGRELAITLYGAKGEIILRKEVKDLQSIQKENINMDQYAKGEYFLSISSKGERPFSQKIIKL